MPDKPTAWLHLPRISIKRPNNNRIGKRLGYQNFDKNFNKNFDQKVNVRIAHLRIAHWGAILRWAILSPSVIRIAHPNYYVFYELFVLDMGPG